MPYITLPTFKPATGLWFILLKTLGLYAITMPWKTIYVLPEHMEWDEMRRHELVHIRQIERDGPVKFSILYLWYLLRYGYRKNPYEIEAYEAE